jgi:hypothetical protein
MKDSISKTQSTRTGKKPSGELHSPKPIVSTHLLSKASIKLWLSSPRNRLLLWGSAAFLLLSFSALIGGLMGFSSAARSRQNQADLEKMVAISEQYQLAGEDLTAGHYEIARQRLDWVLSQDPNFPGANQRLVEVLAILFATATPTPKPTDTPIPATPTLTTTPDMRPLQNLLENAQAQVSKGDWNAVIDTLINLRGLDPDYQVVSVDRMLYLGLRQRGVDKILNQGDLEGGSYDLALAERFGPLDAEANNVREWARIYQYGSAFWGADPKTAVYYFSQVAAAAPYLNDGTGWTAIERYRAVLIQYGDLLASQGDWCNAEGQYNLALSIRNDQAVAATADYAYYQCNPPTATPTLTPTYTITPTLTITETPIPSWTPEPSLTSTSTPVFSDTPIPSQPVNPSPSPTQGSTPPIETPIPSETSIPTISPTPTPTETATVEINPVPPPTKKKP